MSTIQADALTAHVGVPSGTYTTTQTITNIQVPAGAKHAIVVLNCGTFTVDEALTLKVQQATSSGGAYSDVPGATFAEITTANDVAAYVGVVRLHGSGGWLQLVGTQTGATGNALYSATVVFGTYTYSSDADSFVFNVSA